MIETINRDHQMPTKSHTIQKKDPTHSQVWEWEETPELIKALKEYQETVKQVNEKQ